MTHGVVGEQTLEWQSEYCRFKKRQFQPVLILRLHTLDTQKNQPLALLRASWLGWGVTHGVVGEQNGQKRNGHRNITEEVKNLILVDNITD